MADMNKITQQQQQLNAKINTASKSSGTEIAKALTFLIGDRVYGVDISYLTEIIGIPHITVVPGIPCYIKGVINVRSKVVPVIDIRSRFDLPEREYDDKTCTVIINYLDIQVGIIVDQVLEVLSVKAENKADIPALERVNNNKFIEYILETNDSIKMILDVKKLIFDDDFDVEAVAAE
ncbi:MAG: purine-binding chemotaxis protein CheW [Ruminococcaceae bacterium]|nr:purine-binding chemotaxis protein CheW [Oscillospiraceae bacterium]